MTSYNKFCKFCNLKIELNDRSGSGYPTVSQPEKFMIVRGGIKNDNK